MSVRMYEEFMSKSKPKKNIRAFKNKENEELCIAIPLKGGRGKQVELNENFVKVIEHEYAVRYLEHMGINPTVKMISNVL